MPIFAESFRVALAEGGAKALAQEDAAPGGDEQRSGRLLVEEEQRLGRHALQSWRRAEVGMWGGVDDNPPCS